MSWLYNQSGVTYNEMGYTYNEAALLAYIDYIVTFRRRKR